MVKETQSEFGLNSAGSAENTVAYIVEPVCSVKTEMFLTQVKGHQLVKWTLFHELSKTDT